MIQFFPCSNPNSVKISKASSLESPVNIPVSNCDVKVIDQNSNEYIFNELIEYFKKKEEQECIKEVNNDWEFLFFKELLYWKGYNQPINRDKPTMNNSTPATK